VGEIKGEGMLLGRDKGFEASRMVNKDGER